ncbi:MAG: hypothetical protein ACLFVN_09270 [Phycisphaeraceae bacterium]
MLDPDQHLKSRRCPVCFSRDVDVLLVHEDAEHAYCVKCGFRGTEAEVYGMYRDIQKKFHWMIKRVTLEEQRQM